MKEPTLPGFETAISTDEDLVAEAEALLQAGLPDPAARRRWVEIAEEFGWPCYGMTWPEWLEEVESG